MPGLQKTEFSKPTKNSYKNTRPCRVEGEDIPGGFRMFASGYNQGLKVAHDAPSAPLADLGASKVDFDGEEVRYRER